MTLNIHSYNGKGLDVMQDALLQDKCHCGDPTACIPILVDELDKCYYARHKE